MTAKWRLLSFAKAKGKVKNYRKYTKHDFQEFHDLVEKQKLFEEQLTKYTKLELGGEAILQLTLKLFLLAYGSSTTLTYHGWNAFINRKGDIWSISATTWIAISVVLSIVTFLWSHTNYITAFRSHFPKV